MAEILSKQYLDVFSKPKNTLPKPTNFFHRQNKDKRAIIDIVFNERDIEESIDEIASTAAAGPDGFPAILLKTCKKILSKPLLILWRNCFDFGVTPKLFKRSHKFPYIKEEVMQSLEIIDQFLSHHTL